MATDDDLYGLAPEDFIAARDELVRQLKAAGDKDEARRVAKLRRPSVPAWALNQLARTQPDDVAALLAAASNLQDQPTDVRAAMTAYRDAAKHAGAAAARVLRDSGRTADQHLSDIRATLDAAGTDPDLAAALQAGRLEKAGGAGDAAFPLIAVPAGGGARRKAAPGGPPRKAAASSDAEADADAAAEAAEAARAAKLAEKAAAADQVVRERRAELEAAEADVAAAEKELRAVERRLDAATKARQRAETAVERARRDRDRLP